MWFIFFPSRTILLILYSFSRKKKKRIQVNLSRNHAKYNIPDWYLITSKVIEILYEIYFLRLIHISPSSPPIIPFNIDSTNTYIYIYNSSSVFINRRVITFLSILLPEVNWTRRTIYPPASRTTLLSITCHIRIYTGWIIGVDRFGYTPGKIHRGGTWWSIMTIDETR